MSLFNFWKKKDEPDMEADSLNLGLNQNMNDPLGMTENPAEHPSFETGMNNPNTVNLSTMGMNSFNNQSYQPNQGNDKDIQIISLKLDAIKAEIDSINQRIKNIESIAEKEQQAAQQQKRWY